MTAKQKIINIENDYTKNIENIKLQSAKRLLQVRALIKELQKEESELKSVFTEDFISDDVLVTVAEAVRNNLNKKKLIEAVGEEIVEKCTDKTEYKRISVKSR